MTDPTHRHGYDPADLMAWRLAQPSAGLTMTVDQMRTHLLNMVERIDNDIRNLGEQRARIAGQLARLDGPQ